MTKVAISIAAIGLFFVSAAAAQQAGHHNMPMPSAATQQPASGMCGAEDPAKPGMSMGCGACSMMRGMSAAPTGMMGGGVMGMMGSPGDTPRMMEMRAEMMRAMADIMTKYAKQMQQQGGTR